MADLIPNIAKGRFIHYASTAQASPADEGLVLVLLVAASLPDDDTLQDYDTLAAMLAGPATEASFDGYSRRTLSGVTVTVDDTGNDAGYTADPEAYTNIDSGVPMGKAVVCFDPDTTGGTDSDLIPITLLDCAVTFDTGVLVTLTPHADGLGVAQNPA